MQHYQVVWRLGLIALASLPEEFYYALRADEHGVFDGFFAISMEFLVIFLQSLW